MSLLLEWFYVVQYDKFIEFCSAMAGLPSRHKIRLSKLKTDTQLLASKRLPFSRHNLRTHQYETKN